MNIVPARNLGNARLCGQALLDDPSLLGRGPSTSPLGARKYGCCRHRVPINLRVMGTQAHARIRRGRWSSPDAYHDGGLYESRLQRVVPYDILNTYVLSAVRDVALKR